ncbi:MAG: c-type cytochrome domain-containing protein, partial [Cyclobacteriaceae bacterium]
MKRISLVAGSILLCSIIWQGCREKSVDTHGVSLNRGKVDFNYHVKPILSDKCFACHGPDEKKRQVNLRLDTEEGAFKALKSDSNHFAIVRGNPEASFMVRRIFSEDPLFRMPPAESNLVLTEAEKNTLKKWIEQGAEYKKHWAFIPPSKSELPEAPADWAENEIDHFIWAKLQEVGLKPGTPADKE